MKTSLGNADVQALMNNFLMMNILSFSHSSNIYWAQGFGRRDTDMNQHGLGPQETHGHVNTQQNYWMRAEMRCAGFGEPRVTSSPWRIQVQLHMLGLFDLDLESCSLGLHILPSGGEGKNLEGMEEQSVCEEWLQWEEFRARAGGGGRQNWRDVWDRMMGLVVPRSLDCSLKQGQW